MEKDEILAGGVKTFSEMIVGVGSINRDSLSKQKILKELHKLSDKQN